MATLGFSDSERARSPHHVKATTRLPKEEVVLILSMGHPTMPADDDRRSLQLLLQEDTIMAIDDDSRESTAESAEFKALERKKGFIEFQDWVRGELQEKGYVEVPDELISVRERAREWMEEELNEMLERIDFCDESNFDDCTEGQEDPKRRRKLN
jgi:hypothetical protein